MKISIIYYTIGIVILHFIHGSETLKNASKNTPALEEIVTRQPRQHTNDLHIKRKYVKNIQPKINDQSIIRSGHRQVLYPDRFPISDNRHPAHHHKLRVKPILRRRYQINTNSIPTQGYPKRIQKVYSQLSPNYPIKNFPIKKYFKTPQYHHNIIQHQNPYSNPHQRHNFHHHVAPKFSQNHFTADGDLKSSYPQLQKGPLTFGSKRFHASPSFNGNVIVRPSVHEKHTQQHKQFQNEQKRQHDEDDYYHSTKSYPSSYAVYDDTSDDITQKPIQYHVQLKSPSTDNGQADDLQKLPQHKEESQKYLNFMTSRDYFLPKQQPDYHIRTGLISNNQQQIKESNYMNGKTKLDFRTHQYYPSNDFGTNNYHQNTKDWYDPEKLEFTENDAIHSSFTSSPQDEFDVSASKSNYGNNNQIYSTSSFNVASLPAAGNKNNNDKEKWSTPITDINKRKDTFLIKTISDEQISKECAKKCFNEHNGNDLTGEISRRNERKIDANLGFNESELDCYESCINTYTSGGQSN